MLIFQRSWEEEFSSSVTGFELLDLIRAKDYLNSDP